MRMNFLLTALVLLVAVSTCSSSKAAIVATADPSYDTGGAAFTVDPEAVTSANFTFNSTRLMRQTFQTNATVDVDSIVFSLRTNDEGEDSVVTVSVYEIADVTSGTWTPGALVTSFDFAPIASSMQTGLTLSGSDKFVLPERSTGVAGYGIEFDLNDDNTTYGGSMTYSNTGSDEYSEGKLFGPFSRPDGDFGLSISGSTIPEPTTCALMGLLFGLRAVAYRRRS